MRLKSFSFGPYLAVEEAMLPSEYSALAGSLPRKRQKEKIPELGNELPASGHFWV
jgi:hypothetical protein